MRVKKIGKTIHCQEIKQLIEPNSGMTQTLQQPDRDFKITVIYMLKALVEKVENSHEQMGNFSRKMEIPSKIQMEMLEIFLKVNNKNHNIWDKKIPLMVSPTDLIQLSKESVNLKKDQKKLFKLKYERKKEQDKRRRVRGKRNHPLKSYGTISNGLTYT